MSVSDLTAQQLNLYANAKEPIRTLAREVLRLREAIAVHAAKRGHELCWLNDLALWQSIGIQEPYPHQSLPVQSEFLAQCARYYASRVQGSAYEEPSTSRAISKPTGE